jgi:hypothetical protein
MKTVTVTLKMPDALHTELRAVAQESNISPGKYVAETVECLLAERRSS